MPGCAEVRCAFFAMVPAPGGFPSRDTCSNQTSSLQRSVLLQGPSQQPALHYFRAVCPRWTWPLGATRTWALACPDGIYISDYASIYHLQRPRKPPFHPPPHFHPNPTPTLCSWQVLAVALRQIETEHLSLWMKIC